MPHRFSFGKGEKYVPSNEKMEAAADPAGVRGAAETRTPRRPVPDGGGRVSLRTPISYWYCEADGKIYFHGAKSGHKIDAIRRCDKASFCVYDQGFRREGEWALNIKSVIVFGRIHPVEDAQKTEEICRNLCAKFNDDPAYAQGEWEKSGAHVRCLALTPEHMTGKQVIES